MYEQTNKHLTTALTFLPQSLRWEEKGMNVSDVTNGYNI